MTTSTSPCTRTPPQAPARSRLPLPAARPGLLRAGLPCAAWAAVAGLVAVALPVLLLWAADSRSVAGVPSALRTAVELWLYAHGAALHLPGGPVGLVPLALLALPLGLVARAARHAAARHEVATLRDAAALAAGVAGPYALGVTAVAALLQAAGRGTSPVQAAVGASVLGLVGAHAGVLRGSGLLPGLRAELPARVVRTVAGAGAAAALVVAAGALLVTGSLVVHASDAVDLARAGDPGVVGGLGVLLVDLLLAPGAAVWGAAWLAGPGFAVGAGTAVGPFGVVLGGLPAVPLLAALPGTAPPAWVAVAALAVPVLAGVVAARTVRRWGGGLLETALAGPVAGLVLAGLAALSGGPLGDGHLAVVGPSPWRVGLAVAAEVTGGALLALAARRVRLPALRLPGLSLPGLPTLPGLAGLRRLPRLPRPAVPRWLSRR